MRDAAARLARTRHCGAKNHVARAARLVEVTIGDDTRPIDLQLRRGAPWIAWSFMPRVSLGAGNTRLVAIHVFPSSWP